MSTYAKPIILVIDRQPDYIQQTCRILGSNDFQVLVSEDRTSAISAVSEHSVDLILCDIAYNSRQFEHNLVLTIQGLVEKPIPVIFSSAGQAAGVIRRQHKFGGAYHIKKPYDATVLITLVERMLWMPNFAETHLKRPHFEISPVLSASPTVSIPNVAANSSHDRL